jgi:hypothetical protein
LNVEPAWKPALPPYARSVAGLNLISPLPSPYPRLTAIALMKPVWGSTLTTAEATLSFAWT